MIGPLMAFAVLAALPDSYHSVFVVSFVAALLGLAVLLLLVPDLRPRSRAATQALPVTQPPVTQPPRPPRSRPSRRLLADPRLSRLCATAGGLALLTVGDGFLYLTLQQRDDLATHWFPLLYVGTNLAYLALAVPFGRLADRHGRSRIYLLGHLCLLLAYAAAAGPASGALPTVACLASLGAYYAATDGVLPATAGRLVDPAVRASGIATAQTVVAVARFASSAGFGLLWVLVGPRTALTIVGAVLILALALAVRPLLRLESVGG